MRYVIAPDSFKGSLDAVSVARLIDEGIRSVDSSAETVLVPVADGGEGTVHAFMTAAGGTAITDRITGPLGTPVEAVRAVLRDGSGVVEMAQAAGLGLVGDDLRAGDTTTFGVGEQILTALSSSNKLVIGLGGSATNDGGCGAAAACGVRFVRADGEVFVPTGNTLHEIALIDMSGLDLAVRDAQIVAMCDVDNPLTGPTGATAVFGPQKGASPQDVERLDAGLAHLARLIQRDLGMDVDQIPGAGAAGGLGAAVLAFFGGSLKRGIDAVLDAVNFNDLIADADAIITGEGSFDFQSLHGKVVHGIAGRARPAGVPVYALAGKVDPTTVANAAAEGVSGAWAVTPDGMPLDQAIREAPELLREAAARLAREIA